MNAYYTLQPDSLMTSDAKPAVTLGIQGGVGSFNDEAARFFIKTHALKDTDVQYLYTSDNVMAAVAAGTVDRGQCAIYNSAGGWVDETTDALAAYPDLKVVAEFEIKIAHALMLRPDQDLSEIDTIMCHPQVFAQCRKTLTEKYPHLRQLSGEGELIDNARIAEALATGKLADTVAVMGSKALADIYELAVVEDNLQDLKENNTRFVHVMR